MDGGGGRSRNSCRDFLHSASTNEVRLVEAALATMRVGHRHRPRRPRQNPKRVIAEKGYDNDPLQKQLTRRGIELIAPHRENRPRKTVVRCDATGDPRRSSAPPPGSASIANRSCAGIARSPYYQAFFHTACFMIALRRVLQ